MSQKLQLRRNEVLIKISEEKAIENLNTYIQNDDNIYDGQPIVYRYIGNDNTIKSILGIVSIDNKGIRSLTISSSKDDIEGLNHDMDYVNGRIDEIKNEEIDSLNPLNDETPKMFWEGELPNAKADGEYRGIITYVSKRATYNWYATLTVQGSSSVNYPKKNYTIKFYTDDTYTVKDKVYFKNWGAHDSYVMKANWVDHSHVRIISASELWRQVMESRSDFEELPQEIQDAPGHGATLGWSFRFYVNGFYYGLYEMIIAKKDIFGQTKTNPNHSILASESNNNAICAFSKDSWTPTEFSAAWSEELQSTISLETRTSFENIIKLINSSSDDDVREQLPLMMDIKSVIDFDIFARIFNLRDSIGKNQIFYTYDNNMWYEGAWDMDWAFNGSSTSKWQEDYQLYVESGLINKLYDRIEQIWFDDFKERYFELRNSVLSVSNIVSVFENFNDNVAPWLDEDYAETTGNGNFTDLGNPDKLKSNIQAIRHQIHYRTIYMDNIIKNMVRKVSPVLINVDKTNQLFTLSCETPNAVIYYTLDGSVPTTESIEYTGETAFEFNTTINAIAFREGSEHSSMLTYTFEPIDFVELYPIKRIYNTTIRANEKDINTVQTVHVDIYENRPENYPLSIRGKYINTAAKYAYVNSDFLNDPVTQNLLQVEGKYPWVSDMTVPEQVNTDIENYYDAPYIAVVVIEQGNGVKVENMDQFKLYTTNRPSETEFELATPVKTFSSKNLNAGSLVESWGMIDMVLYDNNVAKAPYILSGQHMIRNSNMWAFVNEDFFNNPIQDNIISVSKESYPYNGGQTEPIDYRTVVPSGNIESSAPYILISVATNTNITEENKIKLYKVK